MSERIPTTGREDRAVRPLRVATASLVGTAVEWYDYFIYGLAAAVVFGPLFFPSFSPVAGTLASFATFSVGFIARPIGGIIMGHFGDRVGRKAMLVLSLGLMGVATVGIGLLPTYETIGVWAPALLVLLRFIQGIGVGGEWGGAVLMAVEHAPAGRRNFYGCFPQMGVPAGLILANLVFLAVTSTLSEQALLDWGWRIPFLASAVMVLIGLVIRTHVSESPEFEALKAEQRETRAPIVAVIREDWRSVLLAAGSFIGINTVGYIFMAYLLSYSTKSVGFSRATVLLLVLIASVVWLMIIPIASALSDRHGRSRVLLVGSAGLIASSVALFPMVDTGDIATMLVALLAVAVFMGVVYGPIAALFTDLFRPDVRYSGTSLSYQIGSVIGGGLAPTVAAALFAASGNSVSITVYLAFVTVMSFACIAVITAGLRRSAIRTCEHIEDQVTTG